MSTAFFWAVGIENAFIPEMGVDELGWTAHRERWREDLDLARDLGVTQIRYGLPWNDLHVAPDRFDWSWCDAVLEHLQRIQLEPIWDLVHFGTPAWLVGGMRDPAFPGALEQFATAFATRYRHSLTKFTPFNEPFITAYFRGGIGAWHPFETGQHGFVRSLEPIVEAVARATKAIRAAHPNAEIWLNDGADHFRASTPDLNAKAQELTLNRFAGLDALEGLAGSGSEMFEHLTRAGFDAGLLERLSLEPAGADVIGLDYYPGSEHVIGHRTGPRRAADWGCVEDYEVNPDPNPPGIAATLEVYHRRYQKPLYIAETSADQLRHEWLEYVLSELARVREKGVSVLGLTWWPLFDHIDWNSGLTRLVGHVCPSGLYHLRPSIQDRQPSPLVELFKAAVRAQQPHDFGRRIIPLPKEVNETEAS
jgi:beta-glucosidase